MGKVTKPKYKLQYSYVDFLNKRPAIGTLGWDTKTYGRPTLSNLIKWRKSFNESLQPNGVNGHLFYKHSPVGSVWICLNTSDAPEVLRYKPPTFEVV